MRSNGTKCFLIIFICLTSVQLWAKDIKTAKAPTIKKPLCFVENKGQITDQDNNARTDIQYKLSTAGMNLFVGNGSLHYQFHKAEGGTKSIVPVMNGYRLDVTLIGANPDALMVTGDMQEYYENYYHDAEGITARSYDKVTYKDVYPGIDWVLYINDNKVEYDFVVHEGADVNDIKIAYSGATELSMTKTGGILAKTPMGNIEENTPYAYETNTGKKVSSKFVLKNNVIGFETGKHNGAITIDPYLSWSTYFGGALEDAVTGVKCDATGNIYASGYTASTSGIASAGAYQGAYGGGTFNAFLVKYNAAGILAWATYYGGTGDEQGFSVAVDPAGNPYLTGSCTSPALSTAGAYQTGNAGGQDAFLAKFNALGGLTWATYFGGTATDYANGVYCDGAGNVIIAGYTASSTGIATGGAYQAALSGISDGFIAKFNGAGTMQWATYYGGNANDEVYGVTCDNAANVIVSGQTNSTNAIASAGVYQTMLSGANDAFVASFSAAGVRIWGSYFGGPATEQGNAVASDAANNIYLAGNTTSSTGVASNGAYQQVYGGGLEDAFLAKFNITGGLSWATYYGGNSVDYGQSVCVDIFNNITLAGGTFSSNGIATAGGYQTAIGGDYDAYYAKFNLYGQNIYGSYFGSTFYEYGNGVTTNTNSNIILGGYTSSTAGLATAGAQQTVYGGGIYDGFIGEFSIDTLVSIAQPFTDTIVCAGGTLSVSFTTNISFQPGNIFTVQLSDAFGSFLTPVTIGSSAATASGIIVCTIPAATPLGVGYRIMLLSSLPASTTPDNLLNIQVINNLPAQTVTGTTPVCVGGTIRFHDTATYNIVSYSWSGPGGYTTVLQNPVISPAAVVNGGTYSVTALHNGCPTRTDTIAIVVNSTIPPTPFDSSNAPLCANRTLKLFARSGLTDTTITYSWTGPGGFISTLQNPTIAAATVFNAGTYYVQDTLGKCPSLFDSVKVVINADTPTSITITPHPNDTVCYGSSVSFTTYCVNGGFDPYYQWVVNNAPIAGANFATYITPTLALTSSVYCILQSSLQCPYNMYDTSNVVNVVVWDNTPLVTLLVSPDSSVSPGAAVTFTAYAVTFGTITGFRWYVNGIRVTGDTTSTLTLSGITHGESVYAEAFTNAICADTGKSNTIGIHMLSGVPNTQNNMGNIDFFPNPNNGTFHLMGTIDNNTSGTVTLEILNTLGQVIYTKELQTNNDKLNATIDLEGVPAGLYLLHLQSGSNSMMSRFVIDK